MMKSSQGEGIALSYVVEGTGLPVILLHGLAASRFDWQSLSEALARAGYCAYALDLLGHGDSPQPGDPACYTAELTQEWLVHWLDEQDLAEPAVLIGHSLGGYLSLSLALARPEKFRGMILINPLYRLDQLSPFMRMLNRRPALGSRLLRGIPLRVIDLVLGWDPTPANRFSPEARQQIAIDYKRASPNILHIPSTVTDLTGRLPELDLPALVIWGDRDLTLRPASFEYLVDRLPGAVGTPVHGAGHQPHIGQPDLVNQLVIGFLAEIHIDEHHTSS